MDFPVFLQLTPITEQREQAGLARPGGTTSSTFGSLRIPTTPVHRTPSTPSLATEFFSENQSTTKDNKDSLAELRSNFLEQEAQAGVPKGPRSESQSASSWMSPK